jgi:hypothetical protein
MEFTGILYRAGVPLYDDVLGAIDKNGKSGRFVLHAGQDLLMGSYVLEVGISVRYSIVVRGAIGSPGKPQYYEFAITNALGSGN